MVLQMGGGAFINAENVHEIFSDDRLTVVRKPTSSPVEVCPYVWLGYSAHRSITSGGRQLAVGVSMGVTKLVAAMLVGVGVVICSSNFNHTTLPKLMTPSLIFLQVQPAHVRAKSIISKVKKPTEAEAKALARIFPSSSKPRAIEKAFDPAAECVVSGQQKKKKAAIRPKQRTISISVVMMKKYSSIVPKGKERHNLAAEGRILNMKLTRGMSAKEVKDLI